MSTLAFAALFITAGILLAVQHSYWRGRLDTQTRVTWDALRECTKAQNQLEAIRVRNGERRLLAEIDGFRGDFENVVSLDERRAR